MITVIIDNNGEQWILIGIIKGIPSGVIKRGWLGNLKK
jgi:hypothetical protein